GTFDSSFQTGTFQTGIFGGALSPNFYNPTDGIYFAGGPGSTGYAAGGLPWMGPGGQPFRFYMGNQAHVAIGLQYVQLNPGSLYDEPLSEVARQFALTGLPVSNVPLGQAGFLRPDIVNVQTREVYEIKRLGNEGQGLQELQMYLDALTGAGVPVVPGRMGAPGTYGVVTSPDGGVFEYGTATPGVIGQCPARC